jgi:hypothetical protein
VTTVDLQWVGIIGCVIAAWAVLAFEIGRRIGYWHGFANGLLHRENMEAMNRRIEAVDRMFERGEE